MRKSGTIFAKNTSIAIKSNEEGEDMKKVMVITILFWLVGMGFANAQTTTLFSGKLLNSDRTGPFIATSTEERERADGSRYFYTENVRVGGGEAHFDMTISSSTGEPVSVNIFDKDIVHVISCSGENFAGISKRPAEPITYPLKTGFKAIFLCDFNPGGIVGDGTDGVAYLGMNGTQTEDAVNTPSKFVISGTLTGGFNSDEDNFLFKGSYGTVLTPVIY
jgi:hypothetical protein